MKLRHSLIPICAALCLMSSTLVQSASAQRFQKQGSSAGQKMQKNSGKGQGANGTGTCRQTPQLSTLTDSDVATLKYMFEEEKLAGDVYTKFNVLPFSRIARSERQHQSAIKNQLTLHKIDISELVSLPAGVYSNSELQALYNDLVAKGSASQVEALKVGAAIEEHDIADLITAISQTTAAEVKQVYNNLLAASRQHLAAFVRQLSLNGVSYSTNSISDAQLNNPGRGNGRRLLRKSKNSSANTGGICPNN